ncbi:MAG: T9SS type A sorting domain-containing protein [Bacteroidales bacterium]
MNTFISCRIWDKTGHAIPPKVSYLKVFPNPAGSYFIIEYDLRDKPGDACIKVSDLTGRVISELTLSDARNQRIYDTRKLSVGIYLIKLFTGNQLLEVKKVNISR